MLGSSPSKPMTITFFGKKDLNYGVSLEAFFETSTPADLAGRKILTMRKNMATTLFQKISKRTSRLARPEVTVITWSGPPYSANSSTRIDSPQQHLSGVFVILQ